MASRYRVEFVVQWPNGSGGVLPQTDPASGYYYADFDQAIGRGDATEYDGRADITVGHLDTDSIAGGRRRLPNRRSPMPPTCPSRCSPTRA